MTSLPYRSLSSHFRDQFGQRVHKITVDAGFTCPNRDGTISFGGCIYCNARGSGTGAHEKGASIRQQIEDGKTRLSKRFKANLFMAYFQAFTNTYAPVPVLKACYDEALSVSGVVGLSIGTRPDCVSPEILDLLEGYARDRLVWLEYGLQSANDKTLSRINRGHDFSCFEEAVNATRNRNIRICAHVILGLPGETRDDMLKTADQLAAMGIDGVKLHLLYVVRETPLETLYQEGAVRCLEQDEYADLVCDFIERLPDAMVIHRLTGDPHPHELVAPLWALEKQKTLNLIHQAFEKRNTRQGKRFLPPDASSHLKENPFMNLHKHVLTEKECMALMQTHHVPENIVAHCQKVAAVAGALTRAVNTNGAGLDAELIQSACLVHDVARLETHHGKKAADLLRELGLFKLADIVAVHMDVPVFPEDPLDECQIVFYADKLVMNTTVVSVQDRFAAKARQHGHDPASLANIQRREKAALEVQTKIENLTGKRVSEILAAANLFMAEVDGP